MKNYIAAGFDPARFWDLTLRLFDTEMAGAQKRMENRRSEIWMTAMLPHFKKPMSFNEFVNGKPDRSELAQCIEAWDKIDRALMRSN